jgi:hypothetical protein
MLGFNIETAFDNRSDGFAGFTRGLGKIVEETRIVDH